MRLCARILALLLVAVVGAACGAQPSGEFTGEFAVVALEEAPPRIRQAHERMRGAAGLYVLDEGSQTYLLLCAGRMADSGVAVEVLEISRPDSAREARVLATLKRLPQAGTDYPCGLVSVEGAREVTFRARLNAWAEDVLELQGTPLVE